MKDVLEYTTPQRRRAPEPVQVDLCGELVTFERPKDAVLLRGVERILLGDNIPTFFDDDEEGNTSPAHEVQQWLVGVLGTYYPRFTRRAVDRDDPLNLAATRELIESLLTRWQDYDPDNNPVIVIEGESGAMAAEPVQVKITTPVDTLELDFNPPKDIALFLFAALGTETPYNATNGFLRATLSEEAAADVQRRLLTPNDQDGLDLEDLDQIINDVVESWTSNEEEPKMNRAERRAAEHAKT